jgi:ribosome maturation factor RimP
MLANAPGGSPLTKWGAVVPAFFVVLTQDTAEGRVDPTTFSRELEQRVDALGYELVELDRAGNRQRPILRVFIDRPDSRAGEPGVAVEDCTAVSRALEPWLDSLPDLSERYVLEVSSPGVERPLVRRRDWERFSGADVVVKGKDVLAGRARRLEGTLLGVRGEGDDDRVALRLGDGEEVEVPLADIDRGNLVFRWDRNRPPR